MGTYIEMLFGGAHVGTRPLPVPVDWGRRAVPGALVLVLMLVAAASIASPAAAAGSRQHHGGLKDRFRPKIVGEPRVGVALRATRGVWTRPRPFVYKYRWFRCAAGGTKCSPIAGAAKPLYTLSTQDVGTTLRVTVTARNAAGSARATSRPTLAVLAIPPAVTSSPTVSGTAQQGQAAHRRPGHLERNAADQLQPTSGSAATRAAPTAARSPAPRRRRTQLPRPTSAARSR